VRIERQPVRGEISRDDVAAVLAALLHEAGSVGAVLYAVGGDEAIDEALTAVLTPE
jgi:uncharacterized protein YbjT (DUF2867 family)